MLRTLLIVCALSCSILSVHSFLPDPAHVKDCYHPVYHKYFAVNETIQTGHCSIATCRTPPFDIDETLCECGPTKINYATGCFPSARDYSKDYPDCCERPIICV